MFDTLASLKSETGSTDKETLGMLFSLLPVFRYRTSETEILQLLGLAGLDTELEETLSLCAELVSFMVAADFLYTDSLDLLFDQESYNRGLDQKNSEEVVAQKAQIIEFKLLNNIE